jgi:hypothetical protein
MLQRFVGQTLFIIHEIDGKFLFPKKSDYSNSFCRIKLIEILALADELLCANYQQRS